MEPVTGFEATFLTLVVLLTIESNAGNIGFSTLYFLMALIFLALGIFL